MTEYLKKAKERPSINDSGITEFVNGILEDIRKRGETAVRELAHKYDDWQGDIVLSFEKIADLGRQVPEKIKRDIQFAHRQISGFAREQRESLREFETEIHHGVSLGQKLVPCGVAGCYIPRGRFTHAASAIMSVATAKAAGVPHILACTPPSDGNINPAVAYALDISGANMIMALGGIQAIGTLAFGLFTGKPADIIVGPGNRYVTEAKRLLFGQVGIDVIAGPTELAILADRTADPEMVAVDLVSQAEHGGDSAVWLITDSMEFAERVLEIIPKVINELPDPDVAVASWNDYGEVVLCEDREEIARISDVYAAEHVQVMAEDLDWWLKTLRNYGSLFLGEECTVSHGDKTSGTNHVLPTNRAARYTGGLSVHKFIKVLTYQRMTKEASKEIGTVTSRISRLEGMEGHARAADFRLRKYFPGQDWNFPVYDPDEK
jgi:sulfopropanediol 3-dehydrogenase